mmetsp:Transcript_133379/g.414772  ORF Transcript_133379/g.414772 Transcript_133379/m.414772 type:complete len:349 (-) Transcript_133379:35-1081(-)
MSSAALRAYHLARPAGRAALALLLLGRGAAAVVVKRQPVPKYPAALLGGGGWGWLPSYAAGGRLAPAAPSASLWAAPPLPPLLVLSMVLSPPEAVEWRGMMRRSLPEVARGVAVAGREANVVVRFAVGKPPSESSVGRHDLEDEAARYGDLALLDCQDGFKRMNFTTHGRQNNGKIWHLFDWAARNFPTADLVLKQDDDMVIDWRAALPRMLSRAVLWQAPPGLQLQHLFVGQLCPWILCHVMGDAVGVAPGSRCGGPLFGFSGDLARWAAANGRPEPGPEDMVGCKWANEFERAAGRLDTSGLLAWQDSREVWIHPVKSPAVYATCHDSVIRGSGVGSCWSMRETGR